MSAPAPALPADLAVGLRRLKLAAMRELATRWFDALARIAALTEARPDRSLTSTDIAAPLSQAQIDQAVTDAREGTKVVELIRADTPVDSGEDDFF